MNISLIGMMGSGKTTIGELLAKETGYIFIDTDSEIIKNENRTINKIFEENGEEYFRDIESKTLSNILKKDNQVISTGGGIIKNLENIELLKGKSIVFYLEATEEELFKRVKNNKDRPLLNVENIQDKITKLLKEREESYKKSHYTISTTNKTPKAIIKEITGKINEYSRS